MGNNPSRPSGYGYNYDPTLVYPRSATYLSRSHTQRPWTFGSSRRHRSEDYYRDRDRDEPEYRPRYASQPLMPGYVQPHVQPTYFQPPPPMMQFVPPVIPMAVPPPGMMYAQPPVMMQPVVQPAVQPAAQIPFLQPTMQMPAPVIPPQTQQQPAAVPQPVIPQMPPPPPAQTAATAMPEPIAFPEPQISNPTPPPQPRSTGLAPGQYGPYDHSISPEDDFPVTGLYSHNPIPLPPKNLFLDSPYRSIFRKLKESEVVDPFSRLQRTASVPVGSVRSHSSTSTSHQRRRRGLFGIFGSHRRHDEDGYDTPQEGVAVTGGVYAGMPTLQEMPDGTKALVYNIPPQMVNITATNPTPVVPRRTPTPIIPGPPPEPIVPPPGPVRMPTPEPARAGTPARSRPHALKLDRHSELAGLLHFSPHPVVYENKEYPSAYHLLEAFKFMATRPDIAEKIRKCATPMEAGTLAASKARHVRPDWENIVLGMMDDALYHKFMQHPDLRALLLNTGIVDLVYSELNDSFWGDGALGQGANHLGQALMRVRDWLRAEAPNA